MKQLGKYEIIELLGSGATADVYRAHDETMGRDVALKIFKPALVADATTFARFVQEAQAAAGLFHENIATALDSGEIDGNYYIAMRYAAGQSLDRLLKEGGALPWDEALRMTQQIGSALNYAHEHGFLHRDVKPANIIRSNAGNYVLTDFGLAKAMFSSGVTTHTGAVLGTPSYIPPEIWEGQEASAATDEYSLACVMYEALTGITLFTGATPPAVMGSHFKERRFQAQWPAGVPNGVTDVLAKALAVLPENRYGSVLEFTAALARLGASQTLKAEVKAPASKSEPAKSTAEPVQRPVPQPVQTPPGQPIKPPVDKVPRKGKTWLWVILGLLALSVFVCLTVPMILNLLSTLITPVGTPMPALPENQPVAAPTATSAVSTSMPPACTDVGQTWVSPIDGMTLVCVPAGKFTMGNNDGSEDEKSAHLVTLDAYWIDRNEVTNDQFVRFVNSTSYQTDAEKFGFGAVIVGESWEQVNGAEWRHPSGPQSNLDGKGNHPVVQVSWNDASAYCAWAERGLPTEAQWEKAARGTDGRKYPWGNTFDGTKLNFSDKNANFSSSDKNVDDGYADTAPVGSYPDGASPYGALDMAGNVNEWVRDLFGPYPSGENVNPTGPASGDNRVLRGGGWSNPKDFQNSFFRGQVMINFLFSDYGFRCSFSLK